MKKILIAIIIAMVGMCWARGIQLWCNDCTSCWRIYENGKFPKTLNYDEMGSHEAYVLMNPEDRTLFIHVDGATEVLRGEDQYLMVPPSVRAGSTYVWFCEDRQRWYVIDTRTCEAYIVGGGNLSSPENTNK